MAESHELSASACESLLRSHHVWRGAVSTPAGPRIHPVNYTVIEDAVIIRTSPYSMSGTYGQNTTLALEIDGLDHEQEPGCSVQLRGRCVAVEDHRQIARLREGMQSPPWASGSRSLYVRLQLSELSGRRLGSGWNPTTAVMSHDKAQRSE